MIKIHELENPFNISPGGFRANGISVKSMVISQSQNTHAVF